jgi:hypothetical protein
MPFTGNCNLFITVTDIFMTVKIHRYLLHIYVYVQQWIPLTPLEILAYSTRLKAHIFQLTHYLDNFCWNVILLLNRKSQPHNY